MSNAKESVSVQEFINVKDIDNTFLYTKDGYLISYIKVPPIRLELLSKSEKRNLCDTLTTELSMDKEPWKFIAVSRPLDIYPLINHYLDLKNESLDPIQKDLLQKEIESLSNYAADGDVVERQFYFLLWIKYRDGADRDLQKRAIEFAGHFQAAGINAEVLNKQDIISLCNLVHNPAYITTEDLDVAPIIPILGGGI